MNRSAVGPLKDGLSTTSNNSEMANILNSFFSSVFTQEEDFSIPQPLITFNGDQLCDFTVSSSEVENKLKSLSSGAPGPDLISSKLLNEMSNALAEPIYIIFNKSIHEGKSPTDWKCADITPVFKKGSKGDAGNYRPISLTSILCKVFESFMKEILLTHLLSNNLLRSSQHGFLPGKSTTTNLIEYLDILTQHIDCGKPVDVIYLDFAKAFDKVPHKRLLVKLKALGVAGKFLSWIGDWLSDRKQRVVLNGQCSDWCEVLSGVPQGSVLGPILFLVYINDMDCVLDAASTILFKFADDSKLLKYIESEIDHTKLHAEINSIFQWCEDWGMLLNYEKCKVLHFGHSNPCYDYVIDGFAPAGHVVGATDEEKDLGILIHKSLKPSSQCAAAAKKANQILGQMARSFTYRNKTWIRLYKTYVRPHLEYAIQSWCPWTKADIECLERVQRRAVSMVSGLGDISYDSKLSVLGLPSLEARRLRGDLLLVWRNISGNLGTDQSWFKLVGKRLSMVTRNTGALNLVKPQFNLEIRKHFYTVRAVDAWNSLPYDVQSSEDINTFKNLFDSWLCERDNLSV